MNNKEESKRKVIIAIDGPSASGKGTIARALAKHFSFAYLDTGLLYRAVGLKASAIDPTFEMPEIAIKIAKKFNETWLDDPCLRYDDVSVMASKVAVIPEVRAVLLQFQRDFSLNPKHNGTILDGRDIGTVICPKAPVKLFITANQHTRAMRRYTQMKQIQKSNVSFEKILLDLQNRDKRDENRENAPLRVAKDAVTLDSSQMSVEDATKRAIELTQFALESKEDVFVCY